MKRGWTLMESTTVEDSLERALRTPLDDLIADRPITLVTFEAWCFDHSEDIQLKLLVDELH